MDLVSCLDGSLNVTLEVDVLAASSNRRFLAAASS